MKRDLKPFVVEVKRGTRRSSFLGQMDPSSTTSEAQRRAEATLFAPAIEEAASKPLRNDPSRRILQSLVEPPPQAEPAADTLDYARREVRPRPVGRPRKIKPAPVPFEPAAVVFESEPLSAEPDPVAAPLQAPPVPMRSSAATLDTVSPPSSPTGTEGRTRLRDRSSIIARYVLGIEPAPGERWGRTSRRTGRRSSTSSG